MSTQPTMAKRKSAGIVETVKTIVYAMAIAIGIRTVAFEPFNIPSGSMVPTLLVGDYLFVSKYSYGYSRYSLPFSPPLFSGRIFDHLPHRGDIAVFKWPFDNSTDYIKRVIGLPGDRIRMVHGVLYINGAVAERTPVTDFTDDSGGQQILAREYSEQLPGGPTHMILKQTDEGWPNNTQEYVVPAGNVFAMGDNRDNSSDSRFPLEAHGVGFVPLENLIGRAEFIFFSIDATAPWWEVWEWPFEIRWRRLFNSIA